jgi:hypothetical protein
LIVISHTIFIFPAGVAQEATFVGIAGNTRTNGAAAIGGLGSADLKSVLSGSGAGLRGYHSTGSPNMVGSSDSSILSQTVQAPAMLQSIMPDPHSVNKVQYIYLLYDFDDDKNQNFGLVHSFLTSTEKHAI